MSENYFQAIGNIEDYYIEVKSSKNIKKGESTMANYFKMHKREESWEEEIEKTLLSHQIKKHEIINLIINIVLASLCIFVFKLPLWALPIAFIVCDILMMPLNILFIRVIPNMKEKIRSIDYYIKRNQKLVKMIEEKRDKLEDLPYRSSQKTYLKNDIRALENELLSNEDKIKSLQKEQTTVTSAYDKIAKDNKDKIAEIITLLGSFKLTNAMKEEGINLSEVVAKSRKIKNLLNEKPQMMDISTTTFNLYGAELLNILQDVKAMDHEEQPGYFDKIKELIYEYELHLDRLEERIRKDDYIKTNVDINVLLKEIKKDKKGAEDV